MKCLFNNKNLIAFLLAVWVFVIQMFCNIDSYLFGQCGQYDSAAFFMCGKAWMNGMTPYTEFADSKGPLLWFIYGLGYLMDNYSYVGVFWITCLFMWITLCISYKTAHIILDRVDSLLAAIAMAVPLFYWNFYTETKAEHFCWPFIMHAIYVLLKRIRGIHVQRVDYFVAGMGFVACLLLKWSVAAMFVSFIVSIGILSWQENTFRKFSLWTAIGAVSLFLPFATYFTVVGNWTDFIQEYFVNTFTSVSAPLQETVSSYTNEWLQMFTTKRFIYVVYVASALLVFRRKQWLITLLPFLCGCFFIALSIRHDNFGHYISVASPFAIFAIVAFLVHIRRINSYRIYTMAGIIVAMCYVVWGTIKYGNSFCTKADRIDDYMAVSYALSVQNSAIPHPSVIIIGQERGLALATSLPGTRYWITQMGRSDQMLKEQENAIWAGNADVVVTFTEDVDLQYKDRIIASGYHFLTDKYGGIVYTKHEITMPSKTVHLTPCDIIAKRTYRNLYEGNE